MSHDSQTLFVRPPSDARHLLTARRIPEARSQSSPGCVSAARLPAGPPFAGRFTGQFTLRTVSSVDQLEAVLSALQSPRFPLENALPTLPANPGLYAIHGDELAWTELRLDAPSEDLPLYVGKTEESIVKRDLETHFRDGRTGSSTVRRSLAALLRTELSLSGMPRNPANPGSFSNFGLSPADDAKLTRWMCDRLEIAVWPTDSPRALADIEADVLHRWNPALNIARVEHRSRSFLRAQRKVMADQAREWTP